MDKVITEIKRHYEFIHQARKDIAELRKQRALMKAPLWEEATGTVDAKKDYIKSKIADYDYNISLKEAEIEYSYNLIDILLFEVDDE